MEMERNQYCPICNLEVKYNPRYTNYVCSSCAKCPLDEKGKELVFCNVSLSGGFEAKYKGTNKICDSQVCYIQGVKCWADEARFGGIVIQPMRK